MKIEAIPFHDFVLGTSTSWVPPYMPLTEGLVGFGTLGAVLIILAIADKRGWLHVNEGVIKFGMMSAFVYGIIRLLLSSAKLMFI